MSIGGLESVQPSTLTASAQKTDILGKDDFLRLLVAQLKAQDPLNPMENTEFTAQLAQFSSLEQLSNVNENLKSLISYQTSTDNSQAVGFIGKTVKAEGSSTRVTNGVSDGIHFELGANADTVFISVNDANGNLVKTMETGSLTAGEQNIAWDGTDNAGHEVPDGTYTFKVSASNAAGSEIEAKTLVRGRVTGVTFKNGSTYLLVGEQKIPVSNVLEIDEETLSQETESTDFSSQLL
jgi:flagellar basal-body rod modification protein FlgD